MSTSKPERWNRSLDLAEALYRLGEKAGVAGGKRLADQLTAFAAALPARLVTGTAAETELALLEAETLLELAVRLRYVTEAQVAPVLSSIRTLQSAPPPKLPAPTVPPPVPPPARAAAPRPPAVPPPAAPVDRVLVDGSNFLGRAPGYELGDERSQDQLLFRLQEFQRQHPSHKVVAFFDGRHVVRQLTGGVEVRVTSGNRPADDIIVDYARALPAADRRRCTVVTDDRELSERLRKINVRVESVPWLHSRIARKENTGAPGRTPGLNKAELSEWESFFNEPPKRPGKP